ncbi:hypothetical protein ACH5RR_007393 [Cinchona calisaya]|uniref:Fe2OG dioxygenase domain-containing protein n=1 Tax=Cinchona calisaya TaxID=153742 RepID=A0ABD3ARM6_9GENT
MVTSSVSVAVLDMQEISKQPEKMVKALERWGCFRLINHGIPINLMSEMKATVLSLFDLPLEVKQRNSYPGTLMGYIPIYVSSPVTESMGVFDMAKPEAVDEFCDQLDVSPQQRESMLKYSETVSAIADELGRKMMENFGLAGENLFKGWSSHLRLNRYCNNAQTVGSTVGQRHSDESFLTILLDDERVGGIEILDEQTEEWFPVSPMPGALLINTGDIAKAWSNGRFCNVKHRVQSREPKVRVSIAYFILGPRDTKVESPSKLVDSEHPQLYVPFDFKEYSKLYFSSSQCANGGALEFFHCAN